MEARDDVLSRRQHTPDHSSKTAWSPAVLKGVVVPMSAEVRVEIGGSVETCRCVGLAEDGFVIESERALPLNQLLRCTLRLPDFDELQLLAFAAADGIETRQEIKPMGMSREMADRWCELRQKLSGTIRARGTGPTRPFKSGVYVSIPRSRGDWFWRLFGRLR
jgi:hypothetical protein